MTTTTLDEGATIHACPPPGSGVTPCCGRTPFDLPPPDRMSTIPDLVTCSTGATCSMAIADATYPEGFARCTLEEGHDPDVDPAERWHEHVDRYENPDPGKAYISGHKMRWQMGTGQTLSQAAFQAQR